MAAYGTTAGWRLDDPRVIAEAYPDTFHMPDAEEQALLQRGSLVKLLFVIDDPDEGPLVERMWCVVTGIQEDGETMSVMLDNEPLSECLLHAGDILSAPCSYAVQIVNGELDVEQTQAYLERCASESPERRIW